MYRIVGCCFFILAAILAACAAYVSLPGFLGVALYLAAALIGAAGLLILGLRPKGEP
jgi:hypothetical protein